MSQNSYQLIDLTGNITLSWPSSYGSGISLYDINNITTIQDGYTITFPNATLVNNGISTLINNISVYSFSILANDGVTLITNVTSGQIFNLYLTDNSTSNGTWNVIPFGGGVSSITSITAESSDDSITISNPIITAPGGTIDFQLPTSIFNLNNVATAGIAIITDNDPLTWQTTNLVAGDNIIITNDDGIDGTPIIEVDANLTSISSLQVGDLTLTGNEIETTNVDDNLVISTSGDGNLFLNGVIIDVDANVSAINNLTVSGTFDNPLVPKAWIIFTDSGEESGIVNKNSANITSVTGDNGQYEITFETALETDDYGVLITTGTDNGATPTVTHGYVVYSSKSTASFSIAVVDAGGVLVTSLTNSITVQVLAS